jgi:Family of unknown function (DUF6527)
VSTPCRLVAEPEGVATPGDLWFVEPTQQDGVWFGNHSRLADEYVRDRMATRRPIVVAVGFVNQFGPGVVEFCVDSIPTSNAPGDHSGWTVTGEAPMISVSPSIHMIGIWHGWLKDGVLSDPV